jgi:hypothetical protein
MLKLASLGVFLAVRDDVLPHSDLNLTGDRLVSGHVNNIGLAVSSYSHT